jgi:hypothetical protein
MDTPSVRGRASPGIAQIVFNAKELALQEYLHRHR